MTRVDPANVRFFARTVGIIRMFCGKPPGTEMSHNEIGDTQNVINCQPALNMMRVDKVLLRKRRSRVFYYSLNPQLQENFLEIAEEALARRERVREKKQTSSREKIQTHSRKKGQAYGDQPRYDDVSNAILNRELAFEQRTGAYVPCRQLSYSAPGCTMEGM